jgi:hypothetical protein
VAVHGFAVGLVEAAASRVFAHGKELLGVMDARFGV